MRIPRLLKPAVMAVLVALGLADGAHAANGEQKLWLDNFDAREIFYEQTLGKLPAQILKMRHMKDAWPGGGIFVIPQTKVAPGLTAYVTSGLSNTDMPARKGGKRKARGAPAAAAGYGYEVLVLTAPDQDWPVHLLQDIVRDAIMGGDNLLAEVDEFDGMALEDIDVGEADPFCYLIARARAPLPAGVRLPGGNMTMLVVTTITCEERRWAMRHGRKALLDKLMEAGVGQASRPGRDSVVK